MAVPDWLVPTPGGGLFVDPLHPTHKTVTPTDTQWMAMSDDARWREVDGVRVAAQDAVARAEEVLAVAEESVGVTPGGVSDAAVAALIANPKTRTRGALDAAERTIRPERYRKPADPDDTASIQAALDAADGTPVVLTGGKTYRVSKQIYTAGKDVCLLSEGSSPATILTSVDSTVLRIVGHNPAATTTVSGGVSIGSRFWPVASGAGFFPGMLLTVKSDKLWYYDPRDLAKKSELGLVWGVSPSEVQTLDPANDGFTAAEKVTVTGAEPIRVRIEGVRISGTDVEGQVRRGISIQGAAFPLLRDVEVVDCPTTGIFFDGCYGPRVENARVSGFNAVTTGYGVQTYGCRHARVVHSTFWGGRRAVDFSGGEVISIDSKVIDCQALGGGYEYGGGPYGWAANNATGATNYGFGSHGPSDGAEYVRCYTQGIQYPYSLRGANDAVIDMVHWGPTTQGVVHLNAGSGLTIRGGTVRALRSPLAKDTSLAQGGANINARRADSLVSVTDTYDYASSRVVITDVNAELEDAGIRFASGSVFRGHVHVTGCRIEFATPSGDTHAAFFKHEGPLTAIGGRWRVGPVDFSRLGGTGPVTLTRNVDLAGAQVVSYTNSVATT